jgi:hypothetical protein
MNEPLNNKARRIFWSCIPLGVVVYLFQKYGKAHDNMGSTHWCRVWSSYSDKFSGAIVLIRQPRKEKKDEG